MNAAQVKPFDTGRWLVWGLFAGVLLVAPLVFESAFARSMLAQIGIAIVACLSFNMLLGQGGMLSFGHAVYTGLGTFVAVHAMNGIGGGSLPIPISLTPLVGGLAGAFFAVILGFVTTRKAGTPFAMITLGLGELVFAMSLMIPEFFGGESGITTNRVVGPAVLGITYGSAMQVYYLIALYTFLCAAAMFAFTQTPLGRMLNAVRDNPERVEFVSYEMQRVRYLSFVISGFFAGVAGGMYAMNFEMATAEVVGAGRSGAYLLFTFLGGATVFYGPIIGAVLMVLSFVLLSEFTQAWLLYLGLVFVFMVMFVPGGIASLIAANVHVARYGKLGRLVGPYLALALAALPMAAGAAALIEMVYHVQMNMGLGPELHFLGLVFNVRSAASWLGTVAVLATGAVLFGFARRHVVRLWSELTTEIAAEVADTAAARSRSAAPSSRDAPDGLAAALRLPDEPARTPASAPFAVARPDAPKVLASSGAVTQPSRFALELKDLRKAFGKTEIIRGASLAVAPGDRVAIIGPNGAGKSTLFNLISGRFEASSGEILLNGQRIDGLRPYEISRLGLARSFQVSNLFTRLSVFENLRCAVLWSLGYRYAFWKLLANLDDANARARELMDMIKLAHKHDTLAMNLTYAEQRALEVGVTIASGASVVLLDEPTAGMSKSDTTRFVELIREVTAGKTLLTVEHDMSVVFGLADKIAVLVYGEVIAFGEPEAVRADPRVQEAYLGSMLADRQAARARA